MTCGVPQQSTISRLKLLVYVNDLENIINQIVLSAFMM